MNTTNKKVLFVASIDKHIQRFHIPSIKIFYDHDIDVDVACNGKSLIPFVNKIHQIDFVRNPFSFKNISAIFQLKRLVNSGDYFLIHCHTAVASVLTRLVCISARKKGLVKVVYTAHGFHFFKGAPFYYWCLFYPVEKWFSKYLDCLITINREDFELAVKNFSCKKVRRISGMGVDPHRFDTIGTAERSEVRKSLNIPEDAFVLIYVAEFIKRKNHAFLINSATKLKELIPSLHIILPGRGVLWNNIKEMVAEQKIDHFVHLLGFRDDINKVLGCSDVAISTSKQEGLGLHLVEAMMCGLPAVASQDRGHREIVIHGDNGFLYGQNDTDEFIRFVKTLYDDAELRERLSKNARLNAKRFELSKSINEIKSIYEEVIDTKLCLFKNR